MSNPPSAKAILQLYATMLKTSRSFSSYNFREYFLRRTKSTFRDIQNERDPERVAALYSDNVKELAALKRGAIVNQLYGGWTLAVERQNLARERSDS
ncbi:hypothetical protein BC826DRAFT_1093441 [Russula brevipes]|nr:hypothetical protein BC826DRAFT_1093441 [Russula brevipes]